MNISHSKLFLYPLLKTDKWAKHTRKTIENAIKDTNPDEHINSVIHIEPELKWLNPIISKLLNCLMSILVSSFFVAAIYKVIGVDRNFGSIVISLTIWRLLLIPIIDIMSFSNKKFWEEKQNIRAAQTI